MRKVVFGGKSSHRSCFDRVLVTQSTVLQGQLILTLLLFLHFRRVRLIENIDWFIEIVEAFLKGSLRLVHHSVTFQRLFFLALALWSREVGKWSLLFIDVLCLLYHFLCMLFHLVLKFSSLGRWNSFKVILLLLFFVTCFFQSYYISAACFLACCWIPATRVLAVILLSFIFLG
mmetsp:Transcript_12395/g.19355  ORF Transcript_12395/g.19355 Transcript_12395/m.19355 type:complete len:174 (-) Transcript_12395:147-668(-)